MTIAACNRTNDSICETQAELQCRYVLYVFYYRPSEMRLLYFSTVGFLKFFFLSVAFPARPYIRLPQPVPISKGRRGGCYLKYDPFENSSHVGR